MQNFPKNPCIDCIGVISLSYHLPTQACGTAYICTYLCFIILFCLGHFWAPAGCEVETLQKLCIDKSSREAKGQDGACASSGVCRGVGFTVETLWNKQTENYILFFWFIGLFSLRLLLLSIHTLAHSSPMLSLSIALFLSLDYESGRRGQL